jgi:hypothetical protein
LMPTMLAHPSVVALAFGVKRWRHNVAFSVVGWSNVAVCKLERAHETGNTVGPCQVKSCCHLVSTTVLVGQDVSVALIVAES